VVGSLQNSPLDTAARIEKNFISPLCERSREPRGEPHCCCDPRWRAVADAGDGMRRGWTRQSSLVCVRAGSVIYKGDRTAGNPPPQRGASLEVSEGRKNGVIFFFLSLPGPASCWCCYYWGAEGADSRSCLWCVCVCVRVRASACAWESGSALPGELRAKEGDRFPGPSSAGHPRPTSQRNHRLRSDRRESMGWGFPVPVICCATYGAKTTMLKGSDESWRLIMLGETRRGRLSHATVQPTESSVALDRRRLESDQAHAGQDPNTSSARFLLLPARREYVRAEGPGPKLLWSWLVPPDRRSPCVTCDYGGAEHWRGELWEFPLVPSS